MALQAKQIRRTVVDLSMDVNKKIIQIISHFSTKKNVFKLNGVIIGISLMIDKSVSYFCDTEPADILRTNHSAVPL